MKAQISYTRIGLATVFALMFGTFARDVARWSICYTASTKPCVAENIVEAELIAVLLSTFVGLYIAAGEVKGKPRSQQDTAALIFGIVIAAGFVMLKILEGDNKYPEISNNLTGPIVFLLVAVTVLPLALHRLGDAAVREPLAPLRQLGRVFIVSFFLGGLPWLFVAQLWNAGDDNSSTTKFVIAPGVSVMSGAIFGVVMIHSRVRYWRGLSIFFWTSVAVCFAILWYKLDYLSRNPLVEPNWRYIWASSGPSGRHPWMLDAPMLLIALSGVLMMAVIMLFGGSLRRSCKLIIVTVIFSFVSAACGAWLGIARIDAGRQAVGAPLILALIHGIGPPLALVSLMIGLKGNNLMLIWRSRS